MPQHYTDPSRATETYAIPDCETFVEHLAVRSRGRLALRSAPQLHRPHHPVHNIGDTMPRTYRDLSISEYRAAVRSGPYVWPGGGEQYYLCSDGGILCHRCAYTERRQILRAMRDGFGGGGWCVVAVGNTYNEEPTERLCAHCGAEIGDQGAWSIIVGNIGTVYTGDEYGARQAYADYVHASMDGIGRAAGEPVYLTCDGDPVEEYAEACDE